MKKTISILMALVMLLSVAAIGSFGAYAAEPAEKLDTEGVMGIREGNVYTSELLGIRAVFDDDWYLLNDEEMAQTMGTVAEDSGSDILADALEQSGTACDLYAVKLDGSGDNVILELEDIGALYGVVLDEEAYLKVAMPQLEEALKQMGVTGLKSEPEDMEFAGQVRHSVLVSGNSGGTDFCERIFVIKSGRYMASISIFSKDPSKLDGIMAFFEPLEMDAVDALGEKAGNIYTSDLLKVTAEFDSDWYLLNPEETAQVMGYVADDISDEEMAELLRQSGSTCDLYAVKNDQSGDNINIQLENLGILYGVTLSEEKYVELSMPQLDKAFAQMGMQNVQLEKEDFEFAGKTHHSVFLTAEMNGVPIYERMVVVKAGSYMATVTSFSVTRENVDKVYDFFREA